MAVLKRKWRAVRESYSCLNLYLNDLQSTVFFVLFKKHVSRCLTPLAYILTYSVPYSVP